MKELHQLKDFSAALASELAMGLQPPEEVFKQNGLTKEEGAELLKNEYFKEMIKQAKRDWQSMDNVNQRLKAKASLALEEGLLSLYQMLSNPKESAQARVAAAKELKDIAKVQTDSGNAGTHLPPIQIFLGGNESVNVGGETIEHQPNDNGKSARDVFETSGNSELDIHQRNESSGGGRRSSGGDDEKRMELDLPVLPKSDK